MRCSFQPRASSELRGHAVNASQSSPLTWSKGSSPCPRQERCNLFLTAVGLSLREPDKLYHCRASRGARAAGPHCPWAVPKRRSSSRSARGHQGQDVPCCSDMPRGCSENVCPSASPSRATDTLLHGKHSNHVVLSLQYCSFVRFGSRRELARQTIPRLIRAALLMLDALGTSEAPSARTGSPPGTGQHMPCFDVRHVVVTIVFAHRACCESRPLFVEHEARAWASVGRWQDGCRTGGRPN